MKVLQLKPVLFCLLSGFFMFFEASGQKKQVPSTGSADPPAMAEGNQFMKTGNYPAAIAAYGRVLKEDSTSGKALDSLAKCYRLIGKPDSAIGCYQQLIRINPKNLPALTRLAMVYMMQNDLAKAEKVYEEILKIDPKDPDGYFGMAEVMLKTGRYQPAVVNALKAYELWKNTNKVYAGDALYYAGLGELMAGKNPEAKGYFSRALKLGAEIPEEHLSRVGLTPKK